MTAIAITKNPPSTNKEKGNGQPSRPSGDALSLPALKVPGIPRKSDERQQAVWRFELRDEHQPGVTLGNILQMNLIELRKADRLGLPPGPLLDWITFFKHGQEELTMAKVTHEPVQKAMNRIRQLSADEEARRLAFVRERALRDEVSLLNDAKREGREEVARSMILKTEMDDAVIADLTGLTEQEVMQLRAELKQ